MRFFIGITHFLEVLVLAFFITAFWRMSVQPHVDEKKIKHEADSTSVENLDKLNNLDYLDKFEDSTSVDSTAK